jgi:hypothetical protein
VRLVLVNLFSGAEVPLSVNQRKFAPASSHGPWSIRKIVFSREPTSSDCVLAALDCSSRVALCRVGDGDGWIMAQGRSTFADIAFCMGKLYGLTSDEELGRFDFDITNKHGGAMATSFRLLSVQRAPPANKIYPLNLIDTEYGNHLFDLGDNLAMARPWSRSRYNNVFNIVYDRQRNTHKWAEVTSLDEYALFLGETCSRAVRVPAGGRGQVERNCIYSANHDTSTRQRIGTIKVEHVSHNGRIFFK